MWDIYQLFETDAQRARDMLTRRVKAQDRELALLKRQLADARDLRERADESAKYLSDRLHDRSKVIVQVEAQNAALVKELDALKGTTATLRTFLTSFEALVRVGQQSTETESRKQAQDVTAQDARRTETAYKQAAYDAMTNQRATTGLGPGDIQTANGPLKTKW